MKTVSSAYARAHLPELLTAVSRGERITISRHNKPVADLIPSHKAIKPTPKFGTLKGKVTIIDPNWAKAMTDDEVDAFIEGRY